MDQQHDSLAFTPATRHDGWSPELKGRFLNILSEKGSVRAAAARVGRSAQSAYVQRRRDAQFDRAWAAALVLASRASKQVLADRALEGVEEPVFYRGEQVGTRRRYDTRLLLAHMARLDELALDETATRDAGRFDELVAMIAGERFGAFGDEEAEQDGDELPPDRETYTRAAATRAERSCEKDLPHARTNADQAERRRQIDAAGDAAFTEAAIRWDMWFARACARTDALAIGDFREPQDRIACTLSTSSTSPLSPPSSRGASDPGLSANG